MKAIVLLTITIFVQGASSTNLSSFGSEFYLAFPRSANGAHNISFTVHTLKTTAVQFSISAINGQFNYIGTTTAGNPQVVPIPIGYEVLEDNFFFRRLGLHITSLETEPISVTGWSNGTAYYSFLGLPCHTQPTNEYVYYGVSTLGHNDFFGYILLVGCQNYTNVTVVASEHANFTMSIDPQLTISASKTYSTGETNNFIIHAGQTVLLYQSFADISGTKIIANSSLSVISGHLLSRVPVQYIDAEPIVTQVTPTITWGKEFLLPPHHGRPNGQFYKIIAHRNNTFIERKCDSSDPVNATLASGQVYNFSTVGDVYCSLVSSKPIYIAQIGVSTHFNSGSYGDPTLNTIPPIDQFIHSIEFTTFFSPTLNKASILIPNDQYFENSLIYDDTELINVTWTRVIYYPNNSIAGYAYSLDVSGTHITAHSHPSGKLFATVYGWTAYNGYCYSGGMGLNPINPALPLPEISFTSDLYSVTEGNSNVLIYLNRSANYEDVVTVIVSVSPLQVDTATVGADYTSVSQVITFEPEQSIGSITIPVVNDDLVESTEYFTVTLEVIGNKVVAFPIEECAVEILDNDYVQIGFSDTSLTLVNTTQLYLEVTNHRGILQSGETIRVHLQVQSLTAEQTIPISHFDFYNYSGSFISSFDLRDIPISLLTDTNNDTIVKGRLTLERATVNVTIHPSLITINYSQETNYSLSSLGCAQEFKVSTIYVTQSATPTPSSEEYNSEIATTAIQLQRTSSTSDVASTASPNDCICLSSTLAPVVTSTFTAAHTVIPTLAQVDGNVAAIAGSLIGIVVLIASVVAFVVVSFGCGFYCGNRNYNRMPGPNRAEHIHIAVANPAALNAEEDHDVEPGAEPVVHDNEENGIHVEPNALLNGIEIIYGDANPAALALNAQEDHDVEPDHNTAEHIAVANPATLNAEDVEPGAEPVVHANEENGIHEPNLLQNDTEIIYSDINPAALNPDHDVAEPVVHDNEENGIHDPNSLLHVNDIYNDSTRSDESYSTVQPIDAALPPNDISIDLPDDLPYEPHYYEMVNPVPVYENTGLNNNGERLNENQAVHENTGLNNNGERLNENQAVHENTGLNNNGERFYENQAVHENTGLNNNDERFYENQAVHENTGLNNNGERLYENQAVYENTGLNNNGER